MEFTIRILAGLFLIWIFGVFVGHGAVPLQGATTSNKAGHHLVPTSGLIRCRPVGRRGVEQLLQVVVDTVDTALRGGSRVSAAPGGQLRALKAQIPEFDRRITAWH